jgi:hypothetical protein
MQLRIAYVEQTLTQFAALIPPMTPSETPDQQRQRLMGIVDNGLPLLREFGERTDALTRRGFAAYSSRHRLRYRWKQWRFNHSKEVANAPVLPTPLPLTDAALPPEDAGTTPTDSPVRPEERPGRSAD